MRSASLMYQAFRGPANTFSAFRRLRSDLSGTSDLGGEVPEPARRVGENKMDMGTFEGKSFQLPTFFVGKTSGTSSCLVGHGHASLSSSYSVLSIVASVQGRWHATRQAYLSGCSVRRDFQW